MPTNTIISLNQFKLSIDIIIIINIINNNNNNNNNNNMYNILNTICPCLMIGTWHAPPDIIKYYRYNTVGLCLFSAVVKCSM